MMTESRVSISEQEDSKSKCAKLQSLHVFFCLKHTEHWIQTNQRNSVLIEIAIVELHQLAIVYAYLRVSDWIMLSGMKI